MKQKKVSVMTGDVINFTALTGKDRQQLIAETEALIKSWVKKPEDAEVFRGDSYQLLLDTIENALSRSIQLICWFIKHSTASVKLSTRLSIGVGPVAYRGKSVLDSDGEAFHLSGRNFDKMSNDDLLFVQTEHEEINEHIAIILSFVNLIMKQWKANQAEVIYMVIQAKTQQEISAALKITQSSVNGRLKSAKWNEVAKAISYIAKLSAN